jgi:hypothetical protein
MYGLRTVVHVFHGFRASSGSIRYFVGVNCLPMKLRIVWVDRSLTCVNVVGLWRARSYPTLIDCFPDYTTETDLGERPPTPTQRREKHSMRKANKKKKNMSAIGESDVKPSYYY